MQASPVLAYAKKEDSQSSLGIGAPPYSNQSPALSQQQVVSGPPKKRMKTETPVNHNVPLPSSGGSQHGTPQQPHVALAPHMMGQGQQPNPAQPGMHRYSASPAPAPGAVAGKQPLQYPGQPAHNYGPLGFSIANGMMVHNGTGYNPVPGMQQPPQAPNMHTNLLAAQNQQQAATRAGSPHSLPPSRPASQASVPMRNSPRPPQPLTLGTNPPPALQPPQPDQQGTRPGAGPGQPGMPPNAGMHQPQMPMDPAQMAMFQQMQAQRMGFPGAPNMMPYSAFAMQMPGQAAWRVPTPGQMPMGVGRGQPSQMQYAAAMQQMRRNAAAMQAPPNPPR